MPDHETARKDSDIFATTRWSMVMHAGGQAGTEQSTKALTELCQAYWYPLYVYIRSRGNDPHDAEDLTQGFFEKLLRLESLAAVSPEKGKFRAFLLAALKNFLADEWHKAIAQKRDKRRTFSLDAEAAEARFANEPVDNFTPEHLFDRQWAMTLLETVMRRLAEDYEEAGKGKQFDVLRFSIAGEKNAVSYHGLASELDMSEEAVRVAVFRLRKAYRRTLENEIAHTVADPNEVKEELQALRQILAGN